MYTDTRSLHVGLKTPQTPGYLPLDLTGRTTLSQSNPVVNSKARFQPARGLIFRQATPSLVRSRGDQQHSLTFDSIRVWILLLGTSSRYLERGPTILLPRSPAPVSSTRCTVSTETMCSKGSLGAIVSPTFCCPVNVRQRPVGSQLCRSVKV